MAHNIGMPQYRMGGPAMCPPDFKPPPPTDTHLPVGPQPKKRRKTNNNNAANQIQAQQTPPPTPQDLLPPPPSGYSDTIVASNPFDDTPPQTPSMNHHALFSGMHHGHHGPMHSQIPHPHMMGGPHGPPMRGMNPMGGHMNGPMGGMGSMGPMGPNGMSMGPQHMNARNNMGGHMGGMGSGIPMGGMNPMAMSQMGHGPINRMSPHHPHHNMGMAGGPGMPMGGPNGQRSMGGSPMNPGSIGSPMNSMSMGSPMGMSPNIGSPSNMGMNAIGSPNPINNMGPNAIGSPSNVMNNMVGQNAIGSPNPMNNSNIMGPPLHSPHSNGPPSNMNIGEFLI